MASIIAAVGTVVFMLVFYFASGLVAILALALNILILMGAMSAMNSTLTMPGIAGIALTIGMAVDANVLIYERMREELAAGDRGRQPDADVVCLAGGNRHRWVLLRAETQTPAN